MNAINVETHLLESNLRFDWAEHAQMVVEDAMRLLGLLGIGETASDTDVQFGARILVRMLVDHPFRWNGPTPRRVVFALARDMAPAYGVALSSDFGSLGGL